MDADPNRPVTPQSWLVDVLTALQNLGGVARFDEIYAEVQANRSSLPASWQEIIRRTIMYHSSDSRSFQHGDDLFFSVQGIGEGVWGLRSHVKLTPQAEDLGEPAMIPEGNRSPERVGQVTYRVLRDTEMARRIKLLHENTCQVCGKVLHLPAGLTYSEAHHIIPLGRHNGPDTPGNILVVCPNHHALCDYGALWLDISALRSVSGHQVSRESVDYHNEVIYQR